MGCLRQIVVNIAIHFHLKLMLDAESIEDELTVRMLSPKLQPGQATPTQCIPEFLLRRGRLTTLLASRLNNFGCGRTACLSGHKCLGLTPYPLS